MAVFQMNVLIALHLLDQIFAIKLLDSQLYHYPPELKKKQIQLNTTLRARLHLTGLFHEKDKRNQEGLWRHEYS